MTSTTWRIAGWNVNGLRSVLRTGALQRYVERSRPEWIQNWPGMCVLNGSQLHWTRLMEDALNTKGWKGGKD